MGSLAQEERGVKGAWDGNGMKLLAISTFARPVASKRVVIEILLLSFARVHSSLQMQQLLSRQYELTQCPEPISLDSLLRQLPRTTPFEHHIQIQEPASAVGVAGPVPAAI